MKRLLLILLLPAMCAHAQPNQDSVRLRQLYGDTETFGAAFYQTKLIGTDAPYIVATSADGRAFSGENLSDKVVLIHFWFLTCAGCLLENPILNKIYDTLQYSTNFEMLAFANNTNDELQHFLERDSLFFGTKWQTIKKHPVLKFPVLADPDEEVFNQFRGWSYPGNVIIDRNGVIRKIIYRHELDMTDEEFFEYMLAEIRAVL